ncbi:MAG: 2-C-methyl-D-erythritol 4-phosphate cytidylyltransferase [Spirochaetaceae bacterium]|jgi:2-C-methyl-D-erythritol 4-phosphate cytidylyltransferase|nr:2-C-methyl-D-erythritol 4-phosphate cytidylyltransferase [Spirochaetaceae bacterium]
MSDSIQPKNIGLVLTAGGNSSRMQGLKKEFLPFGKSTVLETCIETFRQFSEITCIAVCTNRPDVPLPKDIIIAPGGQTREESVYNALQMLATRHPQWVLIHDGARPWAAYDLIAGVIEAMKKHQAAIPLSPLTETAKIIDKPLDFSGKSSTEQDTFITGHPKRALMGNAQTPQGFAFEPLLRAFEKAFREGFLAQCTDDAEVWARCYGKPVAAVRGDMANKKITYPEDLP